MADPEPVAAVQMSAGRSLLIIGEAGAAGPSNPYGDPAGHCWVAVDGPASATAHLLTGDEDRTRNMVAFAGAALDLLAATLETRTREVE